MGFVEDVGSKAFEFELTLSILVTIVGSALLAGGVPPGGQMTALFMPITWIYDKTYALQHQLPQHPVSLPVASFMVGLVVVSALLEFIFMIISGFLVLVYVISSIIPAQLSFLVVPLYVLGAFLQLMVWIYTIELILQKLSGITPLGYYARASGGG